MIDREYTGHEKFIKNQILGIVLANGLDPDQISIFFKEIGKISKAHGIALRALRTKNADKRITVKDILTVL